MKKTLFGIVLLSFAVSTSMMTTSASSSLADATLYDGATLAHGLILGRGPVAGLFPEIYGVAQDDRDDWIAKDREAFIAHITTQEPDFLDDFSVAIQSGDHVKVDDALQHARRVAGDYLGAGPAAQVAQDRAKGISWFAAINIIAAVNFRTAVNISVYLQIAEEVFLYQDYYVYAFTEGNGLPELHNDYLVSLVVERLSVA